MRLVREHEAEYGSQWAAIESISAKLRCTAETLRRASAYSAQAELDRRGT